MNYTDPLDSLYKQPPQKGLQPTLAETLSSAFGLENDVANLYDWMTRPTVTPEVGYSYAEDFKRAQLPEEWRPDMATAVSPLDFQEKLDRRRSELKDRATLAASGWTGVAASVAAGMLSPTSFLPMVGQGRRAWGIAEIFALAAAGTSAQEAALYFTQETRSEAEALGNIGIGTIAGGLLGTGLVSLTKAGRTRLFSRMENDMDVDLVPNGSSDGTGPQTRERHFNEAPTSNQVWARRAEPDVEGRDAVATAAARVEPPPLEGRVRLYISGDTVTPDRTLAETASPDEPLYMVDLPEQVQANPNPDGTLEADSDFFRGIASEVYRGRGAAHPEVKQAQELLDEAMAEGGMAIAGMDKTIPTSDAGRSAGVLADSMGAAARRQLNTRGVKLPKSALGRSLFRKLGRISPHFRGAVNWVSPTLRDAMFKMDTTGLAQAGLARQDPSAASGTIADRVAANDYAVYAYLKELDSAYYTYVYGTPAKDFATLKEATLRLKSHFGAVPEGKMSFAEFDEGVYDGLSTGNAPPELAPTIQAFRKFFGHYNDLHKSYHDELLAAGVETGPLYKELQEGEFGEGVSAYAHQKFDTDKILAEGDQFIKAHADYFEQQNLDAFAKGFEKFKNRKANLQFRLDYTRMAQAEKDEAFGETIATIEAMSRTPEFAAHKAATASLRAQAKAEGWPPEQLKEVLKQAREDRSDKLKHFSQERDNLMRKARLMSSLGGGLPEAMRKKLAEVDRYEELIGNMFRSEPAALKALSRKIERTQAKKETDLKKEITAATREVKKALKLIKSSKQALANALLGSVDATARKEAHAGVKKALAEYNTMEARLATVGDSQYALDDRLHELNHIRERVLMDVTELARNRAEKALTAEGKANALKRRIEAAEDARSTGLEADEARETLDNSASLSPEQKAELAAKAESSAEEQLFRLESDFEATWRERGNRAQSVAEGEAAFKEFSEEVALDLYNKLTKADGSPAYFQVLQAERGPQLLRMLKMPYALKKQWLVRNTEHIARAFDRQMGVDLEIWRAFDGHVNGSNIMEAVARDGNELKLQVQNAKYVKLPRGATLNKGVAGFLENTKAMLQRTETNNRLPEDQLDFEFGVEDLADEAKAGYTELTPELRSQLHAIIGAEVTAQQRNFDVAIQRLRRTRGAPDDPNSLLWRGGVALKALNVMTMMGGVLVSSFADVARPVFRHGISKTFGKGWGSYIGNVKGLASGKGFRVAQDDVNKRLGITLEPFMYGRAQAVLDLADPYTVNKTALERGLQFGANKMGLVGLFSYWTNAMKGISANVAHSTFLEYIPRVAEAVNSGKLINGELPKDLQPMLEYLRERGLSLMDINRIALQLGDDSAVEVFSNGARLPNFDQWTDGAAFRAYSAAINSEVNRLIVTPGLERPNWTDENLAYSMLAQFKSFTFAANTRIVMSGMQGSDPYLIQGITMSLALGAASYYTYAMTAGGKTQERMEAMTADEWLYEALDRSGLLGVLSLGQQVGEHIPQLNQLWAFGGEDQQYRRSSGILGSLFGPSFSQIERMGGVVADWDNPDRVESNMNTVRRVLAPFNNVFYVRRAFDAMAAGLASTLGD